MDGTETGIPARLCLVEGCGRPIRARGRCGRHYGRWLKSEEGQANKNNKRATFRMPDSDVDRAYLAGLIDGDGSITRWAPKKGLWAIKVYMTDREIVDRLSANVGGSTSSYLQKKRTKRLYGWELKSQAAVRSFLLAIQPYLRVTNKQRKIREALTEIEANAKTKEAKAKARAGITLFSD